MNDSTSDPMAEITAMKTVAEALSKLDTDSTARVLRWALDRFGIPAGVQPSRRVGRGAMEEKSTDNGSEHEEAQSRFTDLAELYNAASPSTEADRALVAGYWQQFVQGDAEFAAQAINSALKGLGHGVSNITVAFNSLKAQKPALVMQVRKAGTTKQARKKYKLTSAGKNAVEALIGGQ